MNPVYELRLRDIASPAVHTVSPDVSLREAVRRLAESGVSSLIVVADARPVGIITEHDLLLLLDNAPLAEQPVSQFMSAPLLTARADLDFSAAQLMMTNQGVRHLVLVEDAGHLAGMASETDFRRHMTIELLETIQSLNSVMDHGIDLIAPGQTLAFALRSMLARGVDYVIIGIEGKPQGILTERDVPRLFARGVDLDTQKVGEIMTQPLQCIAPETSVAEAARLLEQLGLRHLVVSRADGKLLGVVSQHRILERMGVVLMEASRLQLEDRMKMVLEATGVGIWELDHQRQIMTFSRGLNSMLHLPVERSEQSLEKVLARIHPDDGVLLADALAGLQAVGDGLITLDYRVLDGDGKMRWVSSRGRVVERDAAGQPQRSAGVSIDIDARRKAEIDLQGSQLRQSALMECVPLALCQVNARGELVFVNRHFEKMFGYDLADIPTLEAWWQRAYPDPRYRAWVLESWRSLLKQQEGRHDEIFQALEYSVTCKDGSIRVVEIGAIMLADEMLSTFVDVTERSQQQALLQFSNAILKHISIGAPLADVLDFIAREVDALQSGMACSILLLDAEGVHLRHGAAPGLPETYAAAINGVAIGPAVGSCGTAAYLGETVFVGDIASDPLWANYKSLALGHGLAACWSTPIISSAGKVLGTFAVYWLTAQSEAHPIVQRYVGSAVALAAIAIENNLRDADLRAMVDELRRWQKATLGRENRVLELKREVNALLQKQGEPPRYASVADGGGMA